MKIRLCCLLVIITLIVPLTATAATPKYHGSCTITFQVQKTIIKNFSGTAACEPFEISIADNLVRIPVIAVQVTAMDTGNNSRDKEMHSMFEHEIFPLISGDAGTFAADQFLTSEHNIVRTPEEISFALTIRDITQKVTARITEPQIDSSTISATLIFALSLSSFELDPPSFLGVIKVKDIVKVNVTMSLDRNSAATKMPQAQE